VNDECALRVTDSYAYDVFGATRSVAGAVVHFVEREARLFVDAVERADAVVTFGFGPGVLPGCRQADLKTYTMTSL